MSAFDSTFRAPIPGQSLTVEKGSMPHMKPPKYTKPNDALEFIWKQLNQKESLKQLWNLLENGATVWAVTRAVLYKASLEGIIQMNLAVVLYPTVSKMILAIGKAKGIDVKILPKFRDKTADAMMNKHINDSLGQKNPKPIPFSALKSMDLPKPEDVSNAHKQFTSKNQHLGPIQPETPEQPTGILNRAAGE